MFCVIFCSKIVINRSTSHHGVNHDFAFAAPGFGWRITPPRIKNSAVIRPTVCEIKFI